MATVIGFLDADKNSSKVARLNVRIKLLSLNGIQVVMTFVAKYQLQGLEHYMRK